MRTFVSSLSHETNSFSPIPTRRSAFEAMTLYRPSDGRPGPEADDFVAYGALIKEARRRGDFVFASTYAFAEPSGLCRRDDYEGLRDEILDDLRAAMPVDLVFLVLHGAQMAEGYDDCEGDIVTRARAIVGPEAFIGVELDLHANVTATLTQAADAVLACRYYPHTDFDDRARQLYAIGAAYREGGPRPYTVFVPTPMLGFFFTTLPALGAVTQAAAEAEGRDGVLAASLIHGFPWADTPFTRAGVLVVTVGDRDAALGCAADLSRRFFAVREETLGRFLSLDAVLERIEQASPDPRPFCVGDVADNPGGGAGSDSTFILRAILDRRLEGFGLAMLWDPVACAFAADAGEGAALALRLGGKTGPRAGDPVDVCARVLRVRDDAEQTGIGLRSRLGLAVALEVEGNIVIVNSLRQQTFSPETFTELGVDPTAFRALVVKSSQHFHDLFAPISREVLYCETPGSLNVRFRAKDYTRLPRPLWPLDPIDAI